MFGKTFELSLTKDYVRHWGVNEAVRELIQNALDSESPFIYSFDKEDDDTWTLSLTSEFAELSAATLLLGTTSKADATDKIGSFGEGYKIALLVLTREGYPVAIWNGNRHWHPYFNYSRKYEADILCVGEEAMQHANKGVTFLVSKLSADQIDEIKAQCLHMQDNIGAIKRTEWGDILLDQPGRLYVGGLFITETDKKYGYNIKPEHVKLERDRQTVDSWDLAKLTRNMWYATEEFDRIATMIDEKYPDMEYCTYDAPAAVKDACYRYFRERFPDKFLAKSAQELQDLIRQKMTEYVRMDSLGDLARESKHYSEGPRVPIKTPTELLVQWWAEAKYMKRDDRERAFNKLLDTSRKWRLS